MPQTFNVFSLGVLTDIDTKEGNKRAEAADELEGLSFGEVGDELANHVQEFSPGSQHYQDYGNRYYDQNGRSPETFKIDGGPDQVFDAVATYHATLTYTDGTTANITAVICQDTDGNTYLMPEYTGNADQSDLEHAPIRTLTLDSLQRDRFSGMVGDRQNFDYAPCFVAGTRIRTPNGDRAVEHLRVGDKIQTQDHGDQPIRWIGQANVNAKGNMAPIRISAGALGCGLPDRDLLVSPQHRMLVRSRIAQRMTGTEEVFVPSTQLLGLPGIWCETGVQTVTYLHILLDAHEVIFAENAPSESLFAGPMALDAMTTDARAEIQTLFPDLANSWPQSARPVPKGHVRRGLIARHRKNAQPVLQH